MWFNPWVEWFLKSPFHGILSKDVMLITVTGRKSGKSISTPTNYLRDGNTLWVISWRDRSWWKNLRGGAQARVLLAGRTVEGRGEVLEEQKAVAQGLLEYYTKRPRAARYVRVGLDATGSPILADCERAAQELVVVRIKLA